MKAARDVCTDFQDETYGASDACDSLRANINASRQTWGELRSNFRHANFVAAGLGIYSGGDVAKRGSAKSGGPRKSGKYSAEKPRAGRFRRQPKRVKFDENEKRT